MGGRVTLTLCRGVSDAQHFTGFSAHSCELVWRGEQRPPCGTSLAELILLRLGAAAAAAATAVAAL